MGFLAFKKMDRMVFFAFLSMFAGFGIYLRLKTMSAPIEPFLYIYDILPHWDSSIADILLSDHHRLINIYRNTFSNVLYHQFGLSEITHRVFPVVIALLTFLFVYRFTLKIIGENEAVLALLLVGVSYYSIHNSMKPMYGGFYVFASFMTFYFLWEAFEKGHWFNWLGFAAFNFLNLTESLLSGVFLPALFLVGLILAKYQFTFTGSLSRAKEKCICFVFIFFVSVGLVLTLYQVRGLNLLEQAFDIVFSQNIGEEIASDDVAQVFQVNDLASGFLKLFFEVYSKLNFEYYDFPVASGIYNYLNFAYLVYFVLFLLGLFALYREHKKLFGCFFVIFTLPTLFSAFILRLVEARYLACVLPFYWITVSAGFVHLFSLIKYLGHSKVLANLVVLLSAFLIFSWFLHPKPLWSSKYHDEMFCMYGIKAIADHLKKSIRPSDVVLNITDQVRLESFGDGIISYIENKWYLESFYDEHRLMRLLERTGRVGVWVILKEPIKNEKLLPYYFPRTYLPHLVKKINNFALYYGQLNLTGTVDVEQDKVFFTPFWLFMKAWYFQKITDLDHAEQYYLRMIEHGINADRAFYNLGVLYSSTNIDRGIFYLRKAIGEIQVPTKLPENADLGKVSVLLKKNKKDMPAILKNHGEGLRYYFVKRDGGKYKTFFKEDFLRMGAPVPYSEYYIAASILLYYKYLETHNREFFKEAQIYSSNALMLNPNHRTQNFARSILAEKPGYIPQEKLFMEIGNLNFIREEFPHVIYE